MEFKTGQSLQCYDLLNSKTITCSKDGNSIIFDSFCKSLKCPAKSKYKVEVQKGLKNVDYVKSQASLKADKNYFKLYSRIPDKSYVDGNLELMITPELKTGLVKVLELTRTGDKIFDYSSFLIKVQSQSKIYSNNILNMEMPTNVLMENHVHSGSQTCYQLDNNNKAVIQVINCKLVTFKDNLYKEAQYLQFESICGNLAGCGLNYILTVKVERVRNVGYYKLIDKAKSNTMGLYFQAKTISNTYESVDKVQFKQ